VLLPIPPALEGSGVSVIPAETRIKEVKEMAKHAVGKNYGTVSAERRKEI
jgi:hypothetical protein